MVPSKPKFPLWTKIITGILWILVIVAVIFIMYNAHREVFVSPFGFKSPLRYLKVEHIIAIATIITTAIIATANIILVAVTNSYAVQTKKMVDQHHQTRKDDLKPLFVPGTKMYDRKEKMCNFVFTNVGSTALFVKIYMEIESGKCWSSKQIVLTSRETRCGTFRADDNFVTTIYVYFSDIKANKYMQTINFTSEWGFAFDDSCLPVEQEKEPPWVVLFPPFDDRIFQTQKKE